MSEDSISGIIQELERRRSEEQLSYFVPYPFQRRFLCPIDDQGEPALQVALVAANKIGKTFTGARGAAYHATGLYPDWWTGRKFKKATNIWVAGNTIDNTRDLCQAELFGEPGNDEDFGHGAVPKHLIGRITKYQGVPFAYQTVLVKHTSGKWSKIFFKAFKQGKDAFMGKAIHYVWLDEEVPYDIYSQCLRATILYGGLIGMTFTPESGMTVMVKRFMKELKPQQCFISATMDDAPHLDKKSREQILSGLLPYERQMRELGIPVMGTGLVFPVPEEDITVTPFVIPKRWLRIAGLDFGGIGKDSHPTAMVCYAIDPDTGISYLYDSYRANGKTIPEHWLCMRRIGRIPVAWPHDGLVGDRGSGISYKQQYEKEGANMLSDKFSNPPAEFEKEGTGGNGVRAGLFMMYSDMVSGMFKVFSNQVEWFDEFRQYYMKPNKNGESEIVKVGEDLMSASRYGYCSKRFARLASGHEDKKVMVVPIPSASRW